MARLALLIFAVSLWTFDVSAQSEQQPLGSPETELAPLGPSAAAPPTSVASTVASLAAVVALMVTCFAGYRYLASRAGGLAGQVASVGAPAGIIDLLGKYPLGRGQTLLLLKLDRRVLLVSQTAGSRVGAAPAMSTLCEISDPEEVSAILSKMDTTRESFGDVIASFAGRPSQTADATRTPDGVEVVDLTRDDGPMARLAGLARRRA